MAIIRAMAVLKHKSGLAKDNCVNTFHFTGDPVTATHDLIAASIRAFYVTIPPNVTARLAEYLSTSIDTVDVHQYVVPGTLDVDGKENPSGPPVHTSLGAASQIANINKIGTLNLPAEVAVCVSYQGTPAPGVVQRRRRGRIYVGPLNSGATSNQNTVGTARPSAGVRNVLQEAIIKLAKDVDTAAEWVVYSRPFPGRPYTPRSDKPDLPALAARPATTVNIDQIWVDDEFDTQRRRGGLRTTRTILSTGEL